MAREEEGMALARGGWAVLLAEGTLQEQLREREGRQAVAAGVKREKGYSMNNKQGLPYSIPYSILLPQKGERSCHYLCQKTPPSGMNRKVEFFGDSTYEIPWNSNLGKTHFAVCTTCFGATLMLHVEIPN